MTELKPAKRSLWNIIKEEHLILLVLVFIFYYIWSQHLPPGIAPDETMRCQIPEFIYKNGYLPHGADPALRDANWGISYGFAPYLAQLIGVGFMQVAGLFGGDWFTLLMALRLVNVLCATATVWISVKIANELFKGAARWLFVVLIAALPQFIYLAAYVNNDCFAIFSSAIILYAWIIGLKQKWPMKSCLLLGIGMGLCAMSYYNAYGWLLTSVILFFVSNLALDHAKWKDRHFRVKIYVVAGLFAAIAAWWFIRSYIIYDGDFLGLTITEHYKELYAIDDLKPSHYQTVQEQGLSLYSMLIPMGWAKITYCSAIGTFGSMDVWLPAWVYVVYSILFLTAFIGCVMRFVKFLQERNSGYLKKWLAGLCMALTVVIPIALSIYYSYTSDYQPQGRYILSMLLSFMAFVTAGLETFVHKIFGERATDKILIGFIVLIAAITAYVFLGVYLPLYP